MVRVIAQAILSAAGVVVAFFISDDDAAFPVYQMVVSLLMIAMAAVAVWYGPRLRKLFRS